MNKMESIDDIITAWERCNECRMHPVGLSQAYLDCKYTIGLYCGQDKLVWHTLDLLKELKKQPEIVRCKDCKYCNKYDYMCEHPNEWGNEDTRNQCNPEWFCADGERK